MTTQLDCQYWCGHASSGRCWAWDHSGPRCAPTTPPVPVCATPDAADRTEGEQQ